MTEAEFIDEMDGCGKSATAGGNYSLFKIVALMLFRKLSGIDDTLKDLRSEVSSLEAGLIEHP